MNSVISIAECAIQSALINICDRTPLKWDYASGAREESDPKDRAMEGGKLKAISPVIFTCNAVESVATLIRRHCNEALPVGSRPSGFRRERWRIFRAWPRAARMFVAARQ
jgi:hypothetical protein